MLLLYICCWFGMVLFRLMGFGCGWVMEIYNILRKLRDRGNKIKFLFLIVDNVYVYKYVIMILCESIWYKFLIYYLIVEGLVSFVFSVIESGKIWEE